MTGGGRIRGGRLWAGAVLCAALLCTAVVALPSTAAAAGACSVSNVQSYSGTVSLSYSRTVSDAPDGSGGTASETMSHSADGLDAGTMTPDKADEDFTSTSLSGDVSIGDSWSDTNDGHTTTASLTGHNAPVSGSDAEISFDPSSCVYSVSASVEAPGTATGAFTDEGISDAATSPNMPIPTDFNLSGSITIDAFGVGPSTLSGIEAGFYEFGPLSTWAHGMATLLGVDSGTGDLGPAQLSWNFTPTFKTKVCDVPAVAGKSLSDAKTALSKANCATGTITQQSSTTVPKGDVISITPPAGSLEPAGAKVNIVESSGPPPKKCVVPALAGQTLASAKVALKAANCSEGTVTKKASSTVPKGDVISSSPAARTTHSAGSKVALTISSGKAKAKGGGKASSKAQCKVPKVKGKTLAAAKKALKKAHCGVGKVKKAASAKVAKGKVISSKPGAGAKRKAGAKVALTVSRGKKAGTGKGSTKKSCEVPAVKGKTLAAAKKALKKANCAVGKVTKKASSTVAKGKVISTKPGAGTKHKAGMKVALTVSSGKRGTTTPPKKACIVPNVVGKALAAAKTALKKANCSAGTVTKKASGTVAKGDVISSSPNAGTKHKAGTKVKLTVSSGPGYSVPKS
jgi:beta-lactam-binding protein with PASTA domain